MSQEIQNIWDKSELAYLLLGQRRFSSILLIRWQILAEGSSIRRVLLLFPLLSLILFILIFYLSVSPVQLERISVESRRRFRSSN